MGGTVLILPGSLTPAVGHNDLESALCLGGPSLQCLQEICTGNEKQSLLHYFFLLVGQEGEGHPKKIKVTQVKAPSTFHSEFDSFDWSHLTPVGCVDRAEHTPL